VSLMRLEPDVAQSACRPASSINWPKPLSVVPTGTEWKMRPFGSGLARRRATLGSAHRSGPPLSGGVMRRWITSFVW